MLCAGPCPGLVRGLGRGSPGPCPGLVRGLGRGSLLGTEHTEAPGLSLCSLIQPASRGVTGQLLTSHSSFETKNCITILTDYLNTSPSLFSGSHRHNTVYIYTVYMVCLLLLIQSINRDTSTACWVTMGACSGCFYLRHCPCHRCKPSPWRCHSQSPSSPAGTRSTSHCYPECTYRCHCTNRGNLLHRHKDIITKSEREAVTEFQTEPVLHKRLTILLFERKTSNQETRESLRHH